MRTEKMEKFFSYGGWGGKRAFMVEERGFGLGPIGVCGVLMVCGGREGDGTWLRQRMKDIKDITKESESGSRRKPICENGLF